MCSNMAMGIPTFLERPATTTFFPRVGIPGQTGNSRQVGGSSGGARKKSLLSPVRLIISQTPQGVAGSMVDWSRHMRPTLTTWKPSTSFVGETALQIVRSSMCSRAEDTHVQPGGHRTHPPSLGGRYLAEAAAPAGRPLGGPRSV